MHWTECAVAIVAITLFYKLISQLFSTCKEIKLKRYGAAPQVVVEENPSALQARADDLKRRLMTLEEIVASERSVR